MKYSSSSCGSVFGNVRILLLAFEPKLENGKQLEYAKMCCEYMYMHKKIVICKNQLRKSTQILLHSVVKQVPNMTKWFHTQEWLSRILEFHAIPSLRIKMRRFLNSENHTILKSRVQTNFIMDCYTAL